nr:ParB/Srx family N-terminal domain-containing protein [Burkholderia sp. BCC1977]
MQAQNVETVSIAAEAAESATVLETNFGDEQPVVTVPYSSLRRSPLNARTQPLSGILSLAVNIRAKGLLQNLVVHEMKGARGKQCRYGVCAGQRREAALDLLFEQKHIAADYPVPVRIVSEGEALAISLIENSEREGLDPFDVLRSYRMLAEEGRSVDYIAALFSASPLTIKRRMKLANVSPKLLALLREDGITLDQLAALALADDHETQERVWFDAPNDWQRSPQYLRQAITRTEVDASRSRLCTSSASLLSRRRAGMSDETCSATLKMPDSLPTRNCCSVSRAKNSKPWPRKSVPKGGTGRKHASSVMYSN